MEELARKRDRSMTPPEAVHYDPKSEVRSKGVGFYAFSRDEEGRKREMDNFDEMRENTETQRREREEQAEKKKKAMEEREKVVAEKRDRKLADAFLESLDGV